MSAKSHLTFLL